MNVIPFTRRMCLALAAVLLATPALPAWPPRIGMNLDGVSYYNRAYPLLDRMKTASDWEADVSSAGPVPVNADGYPTAVPPGANSVKVMIGIDPPELPTPDRYVLTWAGAGDFGLVAGRVIERRRGRAVIEAVPGAGPFFDLRWGGLDQANPLRDMHLVREDQEAAWKAGALFNPVFLDRLRPFDTVRTMDWSRTNTAKRAASWANRPRPEQASWSFSEGGGVPLEVQVALANELGRNLWYNVPFQADDDYVAKSVAFMKANLKPGLHLYLEYSNEVWNWAFPAATMAGNLGKPSGMDSVTWYGFRAAQVAKAARIAWGPDPDHRLRTVLATQTAWTGLEQWHILPGVQKVGDPAKLFDAYAVATYFYGPFDAPGAPADWQRTLTWARSGDAGLAGAFAYLQAQGLPALEKSLVYQGAVARKYGWELVAYEGGHHLTGTWSGVSADDAAVSAMIDRMLADPRMGQVYARMIDMFGRNGGTMLAAFNEAGKFWGVLPTIYDTGSPRYDALVTAAKAGEAGRAESSGKAAAR